MEDGAAKKRTQLKKRAIVFLLLAAIVVWMAVADLAHRKMLEVTFLDVGQGDAAFIEIPGGRQILIDGGPDSSVLSGLGRVMPFWDRDIDLIVLSHPDHDHLAGLLEVLKNYNVKGVLWAGVKKETAEFEEWQSLIVKERASVEITQPGERISLDSNQDHYLEVLYSEPDLIGEVAKDTNNSSAVIRLVYGRRSFLFTGDIYGFTEEEIASEGSDLRSDVLKVSHHGSKNSASEKFMARVLPEAAVISAGAGNSYGHPSAEILDLLGKYDIKMMRTDLNGDITFETDGSRLFLKAEKRR